MVPVAGRVVTAVPVVVPETVRQGVLHPVLAIVLLAVLAGVPAAAEETVVAGVRADVLEVAQVRVLGNVRAGVRVAVAQAVPVRAGQVVLDRRR